MKGGSASSYKEHMQIVGGANKRYQEVSRVTMSYRYTMGYHGLCKICFCKGALAEKLELARINGRLGLVRNPVSRCPLFHNH